MGTIERVQEHFKEARQFFDRDRIVGIFLQGSQNYDLDIYGSDVDTKLIVVPTFEDIAMARKPVSTTHVRANNEHIDFKDVRLYMETFRKQNLNFLEILFTRYYGLNPLYEEEWMRLVEAREFIARMNPHRAVKSMKGIAMEKYHAMEHEYPSKLEVLAKYGYDPKQLHHLARVDYFQTQFIEGVPYEQCLKPEGDMHFHLLDIKNGKYDLAEARAMAEELIAHVTSISDQFCAENPEHEDKWCRSLLEDVSYNIMRISVQEELK